MASARRKEKDLASAAPVDLGPLADSVGYLLRRAQMAVFERFFELFARFAIRPAEYSALTVIESNPGLSQTRLADALAINKTNLVALIDALEERRLARRKPTEKDRRSHALYLTRSGKALVRQLHRTDAALDKRISRMMGGDERHRLCDILRRLASL